MRKIERILANSGRQVMVSVPAGQTPRFWNAAIDAICFALRNGATLPTRPTVPHSGGHGWLHLEARHLLCTGYLYAVSPQHRAYVQLRLVGDRAADDAAYDNWHGKETRVAFAQWFETQEIVIDNINLLYEPGVLRPRDRWALVLAALYELGQNNDLPADCYENAVTRCQDGKPLGAVSVNSSGGMLVGRKPGQSVADWAREKAAGSNSWARANADMRSSALQASSMLARLVLHVLSARLFIVLPDNVQGTQDFWLQLGRWLRQRSAGAPAAGCSAYGGSHAGGIAALTPALLDIDHLGGNTSSAANPDWPECFNPYKGGSGPRLDLLLRHGVGPDLAAPFTQAYLLAVLIVDQLLDPLLARLGPDGAFQPALGAGFDWRSYNYLDGQARTLRDAPLRELRAARDRWQRLADEAHTDAERDDYCQQAEQAALEVQRLVARRQAARTADPSPESTARLQLTRLFEELLHRTKEVEERIRTVRAQVKALPPGEERAAKKAEYDALRATYDERLVRRVAECERPLRHNAQWMPGADAAQACNITCNVCRRD